MKKLTILSLIIILALVGWYYRPNPCLSHGEDICTVRYIGNNQCIASLAPAGTRLQLTPQLYCFIIK